MTTSKQKATNFYTHAVSLGTTGLVLFCTNLLSRIFRMSRTEIGIERCRKTLGSGQEATTKLQGKRRRRDGRRAIDLFLPLVPPLVVLFIWDFIVGAVSFMHHTDCTLLLLSSILDTYLHERVFFFFSRLKLLRRIVGRLRLRHRQMMNDDGPTSPPNSCHGNESEPKTFSPFPFFKTFTGCLPPVPDSAP